METLAAGALGASTQSAAPLKGRLKQSVSRWCYEKYSLDDLCKAAVRIGLKGIDLIDSKDWPTVQKYGLVPSMTPGAGTIPDALNRTENHDRLEKEFRENIEKAAKAGVPNVITFSGNRRGLADNVGVDNCVTGLNRVKKIAEDHNVMICLELLNSKVDHPDQMCDHTAWGAGVCKRVNSPRVKLLFDVYHMQIMEGDICRTIADNIQWIAHFHTGGVPGRHEIDETQELNYRFVAKTIADLGFTGYIAREYKLTKGRDGVQTLNRAIEIMDV
jgi:hydroxypyruvate isomerase